MIHTIDTLPAYLYFKIVEEGNLELLTDEKDIDVLELWENIYGEVSNLLNVRGNNKVFDLGKSIHKLSTRIGAVSNSIFHLRRKRDKEIEEVLKGYSYILRDAHFQSDLDQIEREIDNLEIKIARYKNQLKPLLAQKGDIKKQTFEDIYFSYCTIWHPYKEVNTIFIKEFIALEKQVAIKMKNLEKNG